MASSARPDGERSGPYAAGTGNGGSIADILQEIVGNIQNIIRSEVRLAKTEIKEEATTAGKAAGMLAAGAVLAVYAVGILLLCAVYALRGPLPDWAAALVVGLVVAAIAGALVMVGINRIKSVNPKPEQTIDSVKEDVQWVKQQTR
jgi:uncharacterized membrane protein YqjE